MIIPVDEAILRLRLTSDNVQYMNLEGCLKGIEEMIRQYTNNNFHDRMIRSEELLTFSAAAKTITGDDFPDLGFRVGDTIEVSYSLFNRGLFTVAAVGVDSLTVNEELHDETNEAMVTKVLYPADIAEGVLKILSYEDQMGDKLGIKSETISRYSVTYFDMTTNESAEGYPASLLKFLKKYKRLRRS